MSDLLQRARTEGTPIVDGQRVTFVFEGRRPPLLRGDFNDWSTDQAPSWRRRRAGLWTARMSFPEDAYIEYVFGPDEARLADPYNSRLVSNGTGQFNNYFLMPSAGQTNLVRRQRGLPQGRVTRHLVPAREWAVGQERRIVRFYLRRTGE